LCVISLNHFTTISFPFGVHLYFGSGTGTVLADRLIPVPESGFTAGSNTASEKRLVKYEERIIVS
jgi:hypothetical protein